jgi:LuxR family transcriptional regulator, maltose regulon positive regulatory protein
MNTRPPSPLLATKFQVPPLRTALDRPRLLEKLNPALETKLLLISAPVGFGKTTLIVEWFHRLRQKASASVGCAWLSLDDHDNVLNRFLRYLIAALQRLDSRIGRGLDEVLDSVQPPDLEMILTALLNDLLASQEGQPEQQCLLVLDDYHVLENPQIDQVISFLLDHLPANLHLVILSRIDPALPLARLRARGQMVELRERDLRCTAEESDAFLSRIMGLSLSDSQLQRLHNRTEGWISGLQLAGMAAQGAHEGFVDEFTGTHRYILDYLTDEVFAQQAPEMQRFLLETSILNRLCGELCNTVRQSHDSQYILEQLERSNLFVVPLDSVRRWYRYHHLFADLLRQRLQHSLAAAVRPLHQRASAWYADLVGETGDEAALDEAMYHALAASDYPQAANLLEQFADDLWERGGQDKLRRWIAEMPEDVLSVRPLLLIYRGWLASAAGQYDRVELDAVQAERVLATTEANASELHGRIAAVRAFAATFQGDTQATIRFAEAALQKLAQKSTWRSSAAIALGDAYSLSTTTADASKAYHSALNASQLTGNIYLALNAGFKLAATLRQRGLLREACTICTEQIAAAEQSGLVQSPMAGSLYALCGDILWEWDQPAEALSRTAQALEANRQTTHVGFAGWMVLYGARTLLAAKEFDRAAQAIDDLETRYHPLPPWIASPLAGLRALVWMASGDMERAVNWARESGFSTDDDTAQIAARELEYLIFARLLAVQKQVDDSLYLLDRLLESTRRRERYNISLLILLLQTWLYQVSGQGEQALQTLLEALPIGEQGGYILAFVAIGPPLLPLLKAAAAQGVTPEYVRDLLGRITAPAPAQKPDLDALSERETEVLHLIAAGLKNQEIADRLVISLNTVLYHTKNIYSKLHVSHRTQAVQRARELELL